VRRCEGIGSACLTWKPKRPPPWHADPLAVSRLGHRHAEQSWTHLLHHDKRPGREGEDFRDAKPQHPPGLTMAAERLSERRNDHPSRSQALNDRAPGSHYPAERRGSSVGSCGAWECGRSSAAARPCGPSASPQPHPGPPRQTSTHPLGSMPTHSTPSRAARRRSLRFITPTTASTTPDAAASERPELRARDTTQLRPGASRCSRQA
jgi:hypothetical protein